jgi:hypothetical protein
MRCQQLADCLTGFYELRVRAEVTVGGLLRPSLPLCEALVEHRLQLCKIFPGVFDMIDAGVFKAMVGGVAIEDVAIVVQVTAVLSGKRRIGIVVIIDREGVAALIQLRFPELSITALDKEIQAGDFASRQLFQQLA